LSRNAIIFSIVAAVVFVGLTVGIIGFIGMIFVNTPASVKPASDESRIAEANADANLGDAGILELRCGVPDKVVDTSNDNPRPPIPSRLDSYKKPGLKIGFVPKGGHIGDPPPYRWSLLGVVDSKTNKRIGMDEAVKRLPCWKGTK